MNKHFSQNHLKTENFSNNWIARTYEWVTSSKKVTSLKLENFLNRHHKFHIDLFNCDKFEKNVPFKLDFFIYFI